MPASASQSGGGASFSKSKRISQAIVKEISIVSSFPQTYRNREDITNLPPGVLVVGSQNILSNVSERLQTRQGYKLDGVQIFYVLNTAIVSNAVTLNSTSSINTGDYIKVNFTGGVTGVTSGSYYYAIVANSTTLGFATSNANAIAGTYITISGIPTAGNITLEKSSVIAPILSSFDWHTKGNSGVHMRAGFLTSVGNNGRLQFRWKDSSGNVFWSDLLTGLATTSYNFSTYWDSTELIRLSLFVNGTSNIFEWSGAYDTVVSTTTGASNTITMSNHIGRTGFYSMRNMIITIRGIDYTYTGISGSTFTGVTPDPTVGMSVVYSGDIAVQKVVVTPNSSLTATAGGFAPPATFSNGLISTLLNQVFIGSLTSSTYYVSTNATYTDFGVHSPRYPGDGHSATLDDNLVAFVPQENVMYISCGKDFWYNTSLTQSSVYNGASVSALTVEVFADNPLKVNPRQGAQSQGLVGNMKNSVIMISNEPTFDLLGRVDLVLGTPQTTNISDSIKLDFDSYDFTNGHVFYNKYNLYVSVPKSGLIRVYSLNTKSWEAPQTMPVSRFYEVGGELYGHSYNSSESYQLFTGYSDRATSLAPGSPYLVVVNFSYQNEGVRTVQKNANKFYIEGYISGNTSLSCIINYEQDGNLTTQLFTVLGDDISIIGSGEPSNSLGKNPYGESGIGTETSSSLTGLPPKFRVIKTFPRFDFYEYQFSFSILGIDQNFQLLAFGTNAAPSDTTSFAIEE